MDPPPRNGQLLSGDETSSFRRLKVLDSTKKHTFVAPIKRINEGHDVPAFLTSHAYADIGTFIMQLNMAMCPKKSSAGVMPQPWAIDSEISLPESVQQLQNLMKSINAIIEEAPPDPGPRRFGNISFRKWFEILESRVKALLEEHLPKAVLDFQCQDDVSVLDELTPYLMGGFGSAQRLDYGTGHELSFLAFLACIWKLGGFTDKLMNVASVERAIVLGIIEPYLRVVRRLILTYTLEPAGSHGVWGLDDHSFISYILGSAQYCPAITDNEAMPLEGSLPGTPDPGDVAKMKVVDRERKHNMYFSAVGFINDVKTGPFWEHSPILFDISGVRSGWGKINKGMIKMYNAEVLSKFPVVQHFPFGSLFSWEQDPNAIQGQATVHQMSQPNSNMPSSNAPTPRPPQEGTKAPWAGQPSTAAPWARPAPGVSTTGISTTRVPWAGQAGPSVPTRDAGNTGSNVPIRDMVTPGANVPTQAPWASQVSSSMPTREPGNTDPNASTRAPWADKRG